MDFSTHTLALSKTLTALGKDSKNRAMFNLLRLCDRFYKPRVVTNHTAHKKKNNSQQLRYIFLRIYFTFMNHLMLEKLENFTICIDPTYFQSI